MANIEGAYNAMDRNSARLESLESNLVQGESIDAKTLLKQTTRGRGLFNPEPQRRPASQKAERREQVSWKIQAETDRDDP